MKQPLSFIAASAICLISMNQISFGADLLTANEPFAETSRADRSISRGDSDLLVVFGQPGASSDTPLSQKESPRTDAFFSREMNEIADIAVVGNLDVKNDAELTGLNWQEDVAHPLSLDGMAALGSVAPLSLTPMVTGAIIAVPQPSAAYPVNAVPEPGTIGLFGIGAVGLLAALQKRLRRSA